MDIWKRSTFCSDKGGCVEISCVEVGHEDGRVLVRDSKLGDLSPVFAFTPAGWRVFATVAAGWDRESIVLASGVTISKLTGVVGHACICDDRLRHLHFTWEEWDAFVKGVEAGEFTAEVLAGG